jgi:hypothetical protein
MMGLDKYLYNEGFAYRLLPLKPDTTVGPADAVNTGLMYNNMINKFKWGNMKTARYLDHESMTMFYPLVTRLYSSLADNLEKEGHTAEAKNVLKKYDEVMPATITSMEIAVRKYWLSESAYRLDEIAIANRLTEQTDNYVVSLLDYSYSLMQTGDSGVDSRDVQYAMSMLSSMANATKTHKQTALNTKLEAQLQGYYKKFGVPPTR